MVRLFVALDPPEEIKDALAELQEGLPQARWVDIDNLHLTLRFIGTVGAGTLSEVVDALDLLEAPAVTIAPRGFGHFERRGKPSALYVALDASSALVALQRRVEVLVRSAGCAPESRRFTPHITLARFPFATDSASVGRWLETAPPPTIPAFQVAQVTLFQSHLDAAGPRYTIEHQVPLIALPDEDTTGWTGEGV